MSRIQTQASKCVIQQQACASAKAAALPVREDAALGVLNTDPCWRSYTSLKFGNRVFDFTSSLAVRFQQDSSGFWEASVVKLGVFGAGDSPSAAFGELQEEFAVIWDALAFESDDMLTEDARQLKSALRQMVK
jgi:hypothetical protein